MPLAAVLLRELLKKGPIKRFDWYSLFLYSITVGYIFPVFALLLGIRFPANSYVHLHPGAAESIAGAVLLLTLILGSWLGYSLVPKPRRSPPSREKARFNVAILVGLVVILAASTITWIALFGGLKAALSSIMQIRFGRVSADSDISWFGSLTKAAWFTFIIAFAGHLEARRAERRTPLSSWILMFLSAFALLLQGSRGAIGTVLIGVFLYLVRRGTKMPFRGWRRPLRRSKLLLPAIIVVAIAIVVFFKPAITFMGAVLSGYSTQEAVANFWRDTAVGTSSNDGNPALIGKVASEFSHFPILSTLAFEYDRSHPELRDHGRDLWIAIGKLPPAWIYEPEGYPLSYRATDLVLDRWESQIPPGIIAWLLLTSGPVFLLFGSVMTGLLLGISEQAVVRLLRGAWWKDAGYVSFGLMVTAGMSGGSAGDLLRQAGTIVVVLVAATAIGASVQFGRFLLLEKRVEGVPRTGRAIVQR